LATVGWDCHLTGETKSRCTEKLGGSGDVIDGSCGGGGGGILTLNAKDGGGVTSLEGKLFSKITGKKGWGVVCGGLGYHVEGGKIVGVQTENKRIGEGFEWMGMK